jgi:Glycosyl hydrolase family 12
MSTTGNVTGQGVPASFPSIYVGNNGDTQSANDPPMGSYTTKPGDQLPKQISAMQSAMTTAAYNKQGGDFNATYDIWLASGAPTSAYSDALSGFVMVWLYQPTGRSPIGSSKATKTIDGTSSPSNRPVISYVTNSMNKSFNLKPILDDAAANSATYTSGTGASNITSSMYVTDIFFGFEVWTGSAASNLSVTNFSVDVK